MFLIFWCVLGILEVSIDISGSGLFGLNLGHCVTLQVLRLAVSLRVQEEASRLEETDSFSHPSHSVRSRERKSSEICARYHSISTQRQLPFLSLDKVFANKYWMISEE